MKNRKKANEGKISPMKVVPLSFWLMLAITFFVSLVLLGIYKSYARIPNSILLSDDTELQTVDYEAYVDKIKTFKPSSNGFKQYNYLISTKKGLDQILYYELIQDKPEAYIRNLYIERRLRLQLIGLLWFLLGLVLIHKFIRIILHNKYNKFRFAINTAAFFLTCFYLLFFITIPSGWIPAKLIDINGWLKNITSYSSYSSDFRNITDTEFLPQGFLMRIYYAVLSAGVIAFLICNQKVNKRLAGEKSQ
jgi:hypothetical protein